MTQEELKLELGIDDDTTYEDLVSLLDDLNNFSETEIAEIENLSVKKLDNLVVNKADEIKKRMFRFVTSDDRGLIHCLNKRLLVQNLLIKSLTEKLSGLLYQNKETNFGDVSVKNLTVKNEIRSNLTPSKDSANNLGSDTKQWNNVYANKYHIDGAKVLEIGDDDSATVLKIGCEEVAGAIPEVSISNNTVKICGDTTLLEVNGTNESGREHNAFKIKNDTTSNMLFSGDDVFINTDRFVVNRVDLVDKIDTLNDEVEYLKDDKADKFDTYTKDEVYNKSQTYSKNEVDTKSNSTLSQAKTYIDTSIKDLIDNAPEDLNTLRELSESIKDNKDIINTLNTSILKKADKSTTLEGYGINNAYNKSEINSKVNDLKAEIHSTNTYVNDLSNDISDLAQADNEIKASVYTKEELKNIVYTKEEIENIIINPQIGIIDISMSDSEDDYQINSDLTVIDDNNFRKYCIKFRNEADYGNYETHYLIAMYINRDYSNDFEIATNYVYANEIHTITIRKPTEQAEEQFEPYITVEWTNNSLIDSIVNLRSDVNTKVNNLEKELSFKADNDKVDNLRMDFANMIDEKIGTLDSDVTNLKNDKADKTYVNSMVAGAMNTASSYTDNAISKLVNGAPETMDTLNELSNAITSNKNVIDTLNNAISKKANKVDVENTYMEKSGGTFSGDVTFNGNIIAKQKGSNPRNQYGSETYFFNTDSTSTSAYNFGLYQWGDKLQFTTRNSSTNIYKNTAFEINGGTAKVDFKVLPSVNGYDLATMGDIETLQEKTAGIRTNEDGEAIFEGGMRAYNRIELNGEIYSSIVPSNNYSYNLGEDGYAWKDTYTKNLTVYNKVKSNLTPNEDLMYNLGSDVKSWNNIYSKQIFLDGIQAINGDSNGNTINIGSDNRNGGYPKLSFFDGKIRMSATDEMLNIKNDSTDYYKFKVYANGTSSFKLGYNDVNITAPSGFILNGYEIEKRLIDYEEKYFHFLQTEGTNEIMELCAFSENRSFEHLRNIHVFYNRYRRVCEFTIPKICFENDNEIRIDNVCGDTYYYWVLTYDFVNNKITMRTDDDGEHDEYIYVTVTYRMKD